MNFRIAWVEDTMECCGDMELKGRNVRNMSVNQVTSPFGVVRFYGGLKYYCLGHEKR
jgi:hypothetical protein